MTLPVLSLLIFVPLIGAAIGLLIPADQKASIKGWVFAVTLMPLVLVGIMWPSFTGGSAGMQFTENIPWVPSLGISYNLGVDGLSFPLIALTAFVFPLATAAAFGFDKRVKEFFILILVLETAVMGVFLALDYILFYVFWEAVLIPMYFLIAIWGGSRREFAAIKFLIYTMVGSLLMLVGIVALYLATGSQTFSITELANLASSKVSSTWSVWIFLALFLGFAIKVPVWPFHTWLPDAHVEAPTPISVILAAILLKMGTYAIVRISHPTFPEIAQYFAYALGVLGVINIIYGALAAMAQKDVKKLVAYSSVSHMGYVLLGVAAATPESVSGAVFQMVSHGVISAMLFLLVGIFYDRTHTRDMTKLRGMAVAAPTAGVIMTFAAMGNLGLPGLSGFIGEFFTLLGTLNVFTTLVYVTLIGLVLTAAFNLLMLYRVLMGKPREEFAVMPDASPRELFTLVPLMAATLLLGLWPRLIIDMTNPVVTNFVSRLTGGA